MTIRTDAGPHPGRSRWTIGRFMILVAVVAVGTATIKEVGVAVLPMAAASGIAFGLL